MSDMRSNVAHGKYADGHDEVAKTDSRKPGKSHKGGQRTKETRTAYQVPEDEPGPTGSDSA